MGLTVIRTLSDSGLNIHTTSNTNIPSARLGMVVVLQWGFSQQFQNHGSITIKRNRARLGVCFLTMCLLQNRHSHNPLHMYLYDS